MAEVIAPQGKICSIVEMEEPVDRTRAVTEKRHLCLGVDVYQGVLSDR